MADEAAESATQKTCILKASIHCEGCKRKVKKILSQLPGVEFVDVDTKQHKVTVTGNVDADILINKLLKSGKNAELWPHKSPTTKHEHIHKQTQVQLPSSTSDNGSLDKNLPPLKPAEGGAPKTNHQASGGGDDAKQLSPPSLETSGDNAREIKSEEKRSENSCSDQPPPAETKEAVGKSNGGEAKKKKNKKGQTGRGLENQEAAPPPATNHFPFVPPPAYAVSYSTAHPASSYAAAYYAAPPPHAYAYVHQSQPAPSDHETGIIQSQPLDSFEMFSDENPNGCFIM